AIALLDQQSSGNVKRVGRHSAGETGQARLRLLSPAGAQPTVSGGGDLDLGSAQGRPSSLQMNIGPLLKVARPDVQAGRDTAYAEMTMIPRSLTRPLSPVQDPVALARNVPIPELLKIRFVRLDGGKLSGTLDPYRDPDSGSAVYTTFTGTLKDDVIEGTFTARPADRRPYNGTWRATRKKEKGS
ncbi:MAG: hypothetical protein JSV41_03275, partial [Gemmatimonadota bacterium]